MRMRDGEKARQKILEMRDAGLSVDSISEKTGYSLVLVCRVINAAHPLNRSRAKGTGGGIRQMLERMEHKVLGRLIDETGDGYISDQIIKVLEDYYK